MADFSLAPDFVLDKTYGFATLTTMFENGVEQRRQTRQNSITGWHLSYRNRNTTDHDTIKNLYESKYGAYGSFTWLNPEDGQTYTVRFKDDSLKTSYKMYNLWDIEFDLVMVI